MIILTIPLISCSPHLEETTHSFHITEENGVPTAISIGSRYDHLLFRYKEYCHIKQDESRPETILAGAGETYVGENDLIYVLDTRNYRVAVFGPDGTFHYSLGRQGSGPGEFQRISRLQLAGGLVLVGDSSLRRVAVFSLDGQFLRSINYPQVHSESSLPYSTYFVYPIDHGQLLAAQQGFVPPSNSIMMRSSNRLCLLSNDRELLSEVSTPLKRSPFPYEGSETVRYQHGQGILWTDGMRPLMRWYNLDGSVRIAIRIELTPEPVTEADRKRVREQQQQLIDETEHRKLHDAMVRRLEEIEFPEFKGFTHDARPDEYGFVWAPEPL